MPTRADVQNLIYGFLYDHRDRFNAPYGVLTSEKPAKNGGRTYHITFGIARFLDAEIVIYSPNWILLRSSETGRNKFDSAAQLIDYLTKSYL